MSAPNNSTISRAIINTPTNSTARLLTIYGVIPRLDPLGALFFDNTNIIDFLHGWNCECRDFGLTDVQKCSHIPGCVNRETKEAIQLPSGYEQKDRAKLQSELNSVFWQHNMQKDTTANLNQLIMHADNVLALACTSVSNILAQKGALSVLDRVGRCSDSLSAMFLHHSLKLYAKRSWRLGSHETWTEEPDFNELRKFIETRAEAARKETVCDLEFTSGRGSVATVTSTSPPVRPIATGGIRPSLASISVTSTAIRYLVMLLLAGQLPCVDASSIGDPIVGDFGRAAHLVLMTIGLVAFVSTKGGRCMCGGMSMLGLVFLPCAAFLDLVFVWCAASFSFRNCICGEKFIPEGMRDLHPVGVDPSGGARPSKQGQVWKYDGPHGTGEVRLFKRVERPEGEVWEPQEFVAPAAAWVFYLDEFGEDELIMDAETCVRRLYQSLWIFSIGTCVAVISTGVAMFIAWMSSADIGIRVTGMCLAVLRALIILWRWAADLFMSNHHRGAQLRQGNVHAALLTNCRDYRRQTGLDVFPKAGLPQVFSVNAPGIQVKNLLHLGSHRMARLFQSWWLDWCASNYGVRDPDNGTTVMLDVQFGNQSHIVTAPKYIADGLGTGTIQPGYVTWASMLFTTAYVGLVIAQMVLFVLQGLSLVSAAVWGGATGIAIIVTAWLGGAPLVCSGIV